MTAIDLRPEGEMTIIAASQMREQWLAWLTETAGADFSDWPVVGVDMRQIEAFDSAGVQLLLGLRASLAGREQSLALLSPPACVNDAIHRFGLEAELPSADAPKAEPEAASESDSAAAAA